LTKTVGSPVLRSQERVEAVAGQIGQYLDGSRQSFELEVDLSTVTPFQRRVLEAATRVPAGVVATYGEIARRIGKPRAARAVGQALARNPVPIVVPCHRVVAADGSLTGYSGRGGIETKAQLLRLEGAALA
jgi:methylated-DNA-[protein]-cysteine S-methyltransferase